MRGVDTAAARASKRTRPGTGTVGCTYLHTVLADFVAQRPWTTRRR